MSTITQPRTLALWLDSDRPGPGNAVQIIGTARDLAIAAGASVVVADAIGSAVSMLVLCAEHEVPGTAGNLWNLLDGLATAVVEVAA